MEPEEEGSTLRKEEEEEGDEEEEDDSNEDSEEEFLVVDDRSEPEDAKGCNSNNNYNNTNKNYNSSNNSLNNSTSSIGSSSTASVVTGNSSSPGEAATAAASARKSPTQSNGDSSTARTLKTGSEAPRAPQRPQQHILPSVPRAYAAAHRSSSLFAAATTAVRLPQLPSVSGTALAVVPPPQRWLHHRHHHQQQLAAAAQLSRSPYHPHRFPPLVKRMPDDTNRLTTTPVSGEDGPRAEKMVSAASASATAPPPARYSPDRRDSASESRGKQLHQLEEKRRLRLPIQFLK